jgi:hypothetical protein
MSAEKDWIGDRRWPGGRDAILRHPNGSIDIGVYAAIAHRQRAAAITSSMLSAVRLIREAWAAVLTGRPLPENPAVDAGKMDGKSPRSFSR